MSDVIRVPANFYLGKVYYCLYLMEFVSQIYHDENLKAVAFFKPLVFSTCVENKQSCLLLCDNHMELVILVEAHYDCTSEEEDDLIFDELTKSYCKNCIRHYLNKVYDIFPF